MDDLLADFIAETREMLEAIAGEIVAWEADPGDEARLDAIFRFVHTVKGNCGFFDFPRLERLSHAAEDALADCRAGRRRPDRALVSAVLAVIDRIGALTDMIEAGEAIDEGEDRALVDALAAENEGEAVVPVIPSPKGSDPEPSGRSASAQRSIRLPVGLLDDVMKGVSDLVLARNDLARRLRENGNRAEVDAPFDRLSGILAEVREAITRMRMQRLEHLFGTFPRMVRDLANELDKQVMVDFEGGDVELDREMLEIIRDPLTHIVRNALDHGIETPWERRAAGKREIGMLRFAARQAGNRISLVVEDDGRGIDAEQLAAKAIAAGIHTPAEIESMSEESKLHLVFAPGLSTAEQVSAVSGRGVGMDVVRANIEKVGGSIELASSPGEGTRFHIKLPLTLSMIAALTVGCGAHRYAIPRGYVEEIVFAESLDEGIAVAGDRPLVTFRDRRVPCIALKEVLGLEDTGDSRGKRLVLVRLATGETFALAVDEVFDHEDVVVKPLAPAIMDSGLYSGTTLLDDGRPMLLLDMPNIANSLGLTSDTAHAAGRRGEAMAASPEPTLPAMLFTALDGRARAVRLELVRRIDTVERAAIDVDGRRAQVVIDGALVTLAGHDDGPLPEGRCRLLRLGDGETEIAYAVADVRDSVEISGEIVPSVEDPAFDGVALVEGTPVPLIDGHALFARYQSPPRAGQDLVCRLPDESEWARTILAPLVASAGYRVATDEDREADVAIVMGRRPDDEISGASTVIRLRAEAEPDGSDTIYRYDRNGLDAALRQAGRGGDE
ncbi:chemotaxis protein CheA [Qipengyuania sp. MTN3-11]|uniref:chemotaxis protein CheA n=1 Tax=Qipengyuania sp. MTN3-11 TaxID=3056557 RepID=UPI0036F2F39F